MFNVQCSTFTVQRYGDFLAPTIAQKWHSAYQTFGIFAGRSPLAYYIINVREKAKKKLTGETKNKCEIILHFAHFSVSLSEENKPLGI